TAHELRHQVAQPGTGVANPEEAVTGARACATGGLSEDNRWTRKCHHDRDGDEQEVWGRNVANPFVDRHFLALSVIPRTARRRTRLAAPEWGLTPRRPRLRL